MFVVLSIQIKPCIKAMCEYQRLISNTAARNSNIYKLEHVFEIHDGQGAFEVPYAEVLRRGVSKIIT